MAVRGAPKRLAKKAAPVTVDEPPMSAADAERLARELQRRQALREIDRRIKIAESRDNLIPFTEFTMPHPDDPDDPHKSRYDAQYFHRALAAALEEVEQLRYLRLIVTFPPRHGKSELTSRKFIAWLSGRNPYRHVIFGTYNQDFAEDFGRDVRATMLSAPYKDVFPGTALRKGETAADRLKTEAGGLLAFVGRGGSITGRGADYLIIDDPLKDRQEAQSLVIRNELWGWFNDVAMTRLMSDLGAVVIIMTRWHEDDLVGRLTDPQNPYFNPEEAKRWKIINIPALAEKDDILGRKVDEALWPERFSAEYLKAFRDRNPVGFSALYQQRPSPEDGDYFKASMLRTYATGELPDRLRIYAASDHAVGKKQRNDETVLIIFGVDKDSVIWIIDVWWQRQDPKVVADQMLAYMKQWAPITWWAGKDHITKSIGPFLSARMMLERIFVPFVELSDSADKEQKAQSIRGRFSMGMVRLPKNAWWYEKARAQLLKFPNGAQDDFVDAIANAGRGLPYLHGASAPAASIKGPPRVGTFGWVKDAHNRRKKQERRERATQGM